MHWIIDTQQNTYTTDANLRNLPLFQKDNWFHKTVDYVSNAKGTILNNRKIREEIGDQRDMFHAMYQKFGKSFPSQLAGSFCGVYFNSLNKEWVIFTNHSGDQKLFYSRIKNELIISDSVFELNKVLSSKGAKPQLNIKACYSLLSYGYLFNDETLLQEVKRLTAGKMLVINNNAVQTETYYHLNNRPNKNISTKDAVEELDRLFKKAVQLEYEKDVDTNLKHIASLSGGLDSRMTCWVSHELGFKNSLFYTFSQTNYEDMVTAKAIAEKLQTPWKFIPLDGGEYLKETDFVVKESNGLVAYASSSTAYTSHKKLSFDGFGLLHTGQLGDVIIGSYCTPTDAYGDAFDFQSKALSKRFIEKVNFSNSEYANTEMAYMYNRGFNGILCGNFSMQDITEVTSPFLYPELMEFAFSLPIEMRSHHKIYKQWIIQKYPGAAKFKWEAIHAKITTPVFRYKQFQMPYGRLPYTILKRALRQLGIAYLDKKTALENMTPFERWYLENDSLSEFVATYFAQHIQLIEHPELRKDCSTIMNEGAFTEQLQVLTILSFVKQMNF